MPAEMRNNLSRPSPSPSVRGFQAGIPFLDAELVSTTKSHPLGAAAARGWILQTR
jgi:hypothetical protein